MGTMSSAARRAIAPLLCALTLGIGLAAPALAQAGNGLFEKPPETDVARAWLDLLFRGIKLPEGIAYDAQGFTVIAEALNRALALYSTSILVIGGLLLFYNIALLVVETAHYGVPLGRRSAQLWAPIRLVIAIGFLVPVGGSLNSGQYLVVWMAQQGSALASNVWRIASESMKGGFSGIAAPQSPSVANFVAGGLEMELCRGLYRKTFTDFEHSATVSLAGNITAIEKVPRSRFAEESWQYTNRLHNNVPLCGAYRFASAHSPGETPTHAVSAEGAIGRVTDSIADFSRAQADRLIAEVQSLAENNVPIFLGEAPGPGIHDIVMNIVASHKREVDDRIYALMKNDPGLIEETLGESSKAGWILAGGFLMQLSRLQEIYGTLAAHTLPAIQPPVLDEISYMRKPIEDTIASDPLLWNYSDEELRPLRGFYNQMERNAHRAHVWLYDRQLNDVPMLLTSSFDLRDQLNIASDPSSISSLFSRVVNDTAVNYGVWNSPVASPLAGDQPLLAIPAAAQNAITALAEFGRRQVALGNHLFGIASPDIAPAGTLTYTLLLATTGLLFLGSGFALVFLIPLLPFFRFFVGILSWLLSLFEAVLAVPLVALAHLNFSGEGLSGGAAKQAYLMWLNIIIRPVLTLFGLIIGLLLFTLAIVFLGMIFYPLARLAPANSGGMFVTINVVLTLLYTVLACAAANVAFRGITLLPEMAFTWLSNLSLPSAPEAIPVSTATGSAGSYLLSSSSIAIGGSANVTAPKSLTDRPHGMKLALFPNYKDEGRNEAAQSNLTRLESSHTSTTNVNNTGRDPTVNVTQSSVGAPTQRMDKPRSEKALDRQTGHKKDGLKNELDKDTNKKEENKKPEEKELKNPFKKSEDP